MSTPYNNKTAIDPGRFRYKIDFYTVTTQRKEFGGQEPTYTLSRSTRAVMERIETRASSVYAQLAIEAGANMMTGDVYYVVRWTKEWEPTKNMIALVNGQTYEIRGIIPVDNPVNYWRILCTTNQIGITT